MRTLSDEPMLEIAYICHLGTISLGFLQCNGHCILGGMALLNDKDINDLTGAIIGGGMAVHRRLGPGLLESVYDVCFAYELTLRGLTVQRGVEVPIRYKGLVVNTRLTLDLVVNDTVVVEVKAVDALASIHRAQVLTYLKLASCPIGLLINFNVPVLKDGIRRVANPALLGDKILAENVDAPEFEERALPGS